MCNPALRFPDYRWLSTLENGAEGMIIHVDACTLVMLYNVPALYGLERGPRKKRQTT